MKSASTGAASGCVVWVLTFFILSTCLCPLSATAATLSAFAASDAIANLEGPWLCPPGTTGKIRTFETTSNDENGNPQQATGYEMICVDASGAEVTNTGPVYAFIWIGILSAVGLILAALLSIFLAVPVGAVIARWMSRRSAPPMGAA